METLMKTPKHGEHERWSVIDEVVDEGELHTSIDQDNPTLLEAHVVHNKQNESAFDAMENLCEMNL